MSVKTLGEICAFITKGATPTTYGFRWELSGVPFLRSECVSDSGLNMRASMFISRAANSALSRSQVVDGDILITITGYVGRVIRLKGIGAANINQHIARIRVRDARFDRGFVYHYLSQRSIREYYESIITGQAYPQISLAQVRATEIPLVPLAAQREIAAALDAIDDQIAGLGRLIAKKRAIKQGLMQQLLTGRTRLAGFSKPWEPHLLGELLAYEQPGPYLVSSTDYFTSGTPVLTAGKTFVLGYTSERHGLYQAVPVIIFDDFTTASKYVDFPFKAKSSAMKMLSAIPGVNLRYVYERMQLIDFVAVDHKRRWIGEYSKIEVDVPSPDEQAAIASVLSDADDELALLRDKLDKANHIKQGMMQELLTGRTRLPAEATS